MHLPTLLPASQQALAMADPSEPKYCHCQRISFGEMIACENPGGCGPGPLAAWPCPACVDGGSKRLQGGAATRACPASLPADCPYEWFHFDCVGLTEENRPKGALLGAGATAPHVIAVSPIRNCWVDAAARLPCCAAGKWYCKDCRKVLGKK